MAEQEMRAYSFFHPKLRRENEVHSLFSCKMTKKVIFACILLPWISMYCQTSWSPYTKVFFPTTEEQLLDTMSVLPGSLRCYVNDTLLKSPQFTVDYVTKKIRFSGDIKDSVKVNYTRLNANLTINYQRFDTSLIHRRGQENLFQISPTDTDLNSYFGGIELAKKGSISRGISFGNQQNLGINSTLNLELSGQLSDRLNVLASVSDANIPIQPDGNTNKLQEFDQVFIQIYNDQLKLVAGDFWCAKPYGYFMNYRKRGQGVSNTVELKKEKGSLFFQTSAGLSKGKFQRQILSGIENNQGPYRLRGAENEPFIVVLSGTEKVYLDGRLLARGQEFDYTIDYNSAELVFTPKNLITKDIRIVVEFQYSDQSYARALWQQSVKYSTKSTVVFVNGYQEQDLKNQPLQLSLDGKNKAFLSNVGDSLQLAVLPTLDSVGFLTNQNLYALRDSLGYDSILVFSVVPDSALFRATFTKVGMHNGDYIFEKTTAFGPVYRWIEPLNGISQGDYAPVQRFITPKRRRMINAGLSQNIGKNWKISQEFSASETDLNLFSKKDNLNDWGYGSHTRLVHEKQPTKKGWKNRTQAEFELLSTWFNPIEPYRKVEFDRDWNIRGLGLSGQQRFGFIEQNFEHDTKGKAQFKVQSFGIGKQYEGQRIYSEGALKNKRLSAVWDASALRSSLAKKSTYIRHRCDLVYTGKFLKIGFKDDQEFNLRDTLVGKSSLSYGFFDYQLYLENADSSKNKIRIFLRDRLDYKPTNSRFQQAARGTSVGAMLQHKTAKGNGFQSTLAYRSLMPTDSTLISFVPDQSIVGRLEFVFKGLKGALTLNSYYEINSGLEQKRSFIYLEVNAGQGNYTWIDYNNDGVKDLNEFEIAAYVDQANYIRVFTPSNDYQKTYSNEFNQSLFWRPEILWSKKTGLLKALSVLSNQFRMRSVRKLDQLYAPELWNPFQSELTSASLISSNYSLKNTVFLFRTSSKVNIQYDVHKAVNKNLLANGFDGRSLSYQSFMIRWNIIPSISIKSEYQQGKKSSVVDYTSGRNYDITYAYSHSEISYQPSTNYRFGASFKIGEKENAPLYGMAWLKNYEIGATFKYNTTQKGSLQADMKYLNLQYTGSNQGAIAFEMLESLQPGENYTWSILWQRSLGKNLQLNIQYSGRKPANRGAIHNGAMELRAFF